MFRKAREKSRFDGQTVPDVGRPPTPPQRSLPPPSSPTSIAHNSSPYFSPVATPTPKLTGMKAQLVQQSLDSRPVATARKSASSSSFRSQSHPNRSILNFFAKSTRPNDGSKNTSVDQELFFQDPAEHESIILPSRRSNSPPFLQESNHGVDQSYDDTRYNECVTPSKKQRVGSGNQTCSEEQVLAEEDNGIDPSGMAAQPQSSRDPSHQRSCKQLGPFVEDSDSDQDTEQVRLGEEVPAQDANFVSPVRQSSTLRHVRMGTSTAPTDSIVQATDEKARGDDQVPDHSDGSSTEKPSLTRESTSIPPADEFEGLEDFEDEYFEGGEEYMERRMMEEQLLLEEGLEANPEPETGRETSIPADRDAEQSTSDTAATCPICSQSMKGTTEAEASAHVNGCLDGKPTPLPKSITPDKSDAGVSATPVNGAKRFQRAAVARPGQQDPFSPSKDGSTTSAFSKIMSGNNEDAAWAAAAASEVSSRGKPAYQRTCPFYKIMPGLSICVDAFRYGKVEGQNAYFLSHFHSDHYIGLTSSWCHGPVYCSKVTANLVRQQLRLDPKWVVALEFEKKVEVPNTGGVLVTMIPANHCPGSSLYLFEKAVGKGPKPKVNRILHCGDFRACPAHVNHPLLRPEVVDAISGKTRQQTIDTCYLDTTYLTPKYAFPSQEDVINSCAEMCLSMSKDIPDNDDGWEGAKLERAGSSMARFLQYASSTTETESPAPPKRRGRLLVVIGTYSIGKERICVGIAKALKSKIYAPAGKQRICAALEDGELSSLLTTKPHEAQVHMQTLMEIRAETLHEYLSGQSGHFSRVVGFRPTGWNYRPPTGRLVDNPSVSTVLHGDSWKSRFGPRDLTPQRGSNRHATCFGVPYSEHSSFRELTMFVCGLNIGRVVPTVNVGGAKSRERMKAWIERWEVERRKNGLFRVGDGVTDW